jgi:hypothetical protein
LIGNAGEHLWPECRVGDCAVNLVQETFEVHPRPRIIGLTAKQRAFPASKIDPSGVWMIDFFTGDITALIHGSHLLDENRELLKL